jgi:NADPH-dependent F420 reductase
MRLAFVGGTGPLGRGLGLRLAQAGHDVIIGSRDAGRADEAAAAIGARGATNADACADAELVLLTLPFEAQAEALPPLAGGCAGKIVVSTVVPMGHDSRGPHLLRVPEGSAAEQAQTLLVSSTVVSGFQLVPAPKLLKPDVIVEMDVPLCGDDETAVATVAELTEQIKALRPVVAGPLRLSSAVEGITPLLLSINKRYKRHAGIRFANLD